MNSKISSLKEKLSQALSSTVRVISDDFKIKDDFTKGKDANKVDSFEIDSLSDPTDFIRLRAEADSSALKKKFSDKKIFKKNTPLNSSAHSLYTVAEKVRYELLGCKMLKGIEKNLHKNYNYLVSIKKKEQLKSKEDVSINEAFEMYMLKHFHNIQLNSLYLLALILTITIKVKLRYFF